MTQTPEEKAAAAEAARLMLYYRLTPDMVLKIEQWQRENGLAILMGHSTLSTGTDHAHDSGLIRGRLDFRLNKALGLVEAFTSKLTDNELFELGISPLRNKTAAVLGALSIYMDIIPAVQAIGSVYGLIGKAKRKKKMVYGSPNGPLPPVKKVKK